MLFLSLRPTLFLVQSRSLSGRHVSTSFLDPGLLAFSMSLFSDVGPLEAIAENKTEQKSGGKRAVAKSTPKAAKDARFPTARSV